ncbi:meprin A subunit beta-like [Sinocyclocheilus grahami]|uniref:meprin A subunit beta-like n=1 Tax=Sinocyclocheilus grahami TaxID=75366 RepID=UPI0007AC9796|nr:PREDICTED: meprin A subunit beta-like [Sinocyclocheilus grahami]
MRPPLSPDLGLNLREGDIMMVSSQKSAILGNRWDISVPYELSVNLSVNYKGVIWRAFEQFRLKSCIDFKPRAAEDISYVSLESHNGCWSYVGRTFAGAQALSIGDGCGTKAIVEHEFLHALGFWHEQSRYDRDDYVTINFENIITGQEHNFNKYSENQTTTQDTQYDYYSVMHYDKNAFSNGNGSTIITKRPEFQDVIGQRLDLSEYDVIELNKLYKCNSSISFLDHCSFDDESLCQMSVCSAGDYGWQRMKSVSGINVTDHTYLGKEQNGTSFFMHFSTEGRNEGDAAKMESKTMTPKRDCKVQCLQFYYYHSGHESDQLNIWIREYQNEADSRGTLRLMDQITEPPGNYWKLHHVPLNANKTFQVVFEARKGAGNSSGGFSLDDINISETECPHTWQIRDFEKSWMRSSSLQVQSSSKHSLSQVNKDGDVATVAPFIMPTGPQIAQLSAKKKCRHCVKFNQCCKVVQIKVQFAAFTSSAPPLQPVDWPTKPWEHLQMYVCGELASIPHHKRFLAVVYDIHSKWPKVVPMGSVTASTLVDFLEQLFSRWGILRAITTDNGLQFVSNEFSS